MGDVLKIFTLFFTVFCLFFSMHSEEKTVPLEEQIPEHYFCGLEKTIFNEQERRETFLKKFFSPEEIEKIGNAHLCLYNNEIIKKNIETKSFDENLLKRVLNEKCSSIDSEIPWFTHRFWKSRMYRSIDKKMLCRSKNDCAIVVEENDQKTVLGWLKHGVEVFLKKNDSSFYLSGEKYDLEPYLKKNGFVDFKKYVEVGYTYGGLGNQLFMYWSAIIHARANNKEPLKMHNWYLDNFLDLPVKATSNRPIGHYHQLPEFVKRALGLKFCASSHHVSYDSNCFMVKGYLQSWKNFIGHEDYIRENMIFKNEVSDKSRETMDKMKNENAVSLHVRRGDYILQGYILLTQDYYSKAIDYIKRNVKNPVFYVFSNDMKWAKENIKIDAPHVYVDWTKRDYEDLQLMAECKHFVNANSSFSWWGSFLGKNKNKIIIAPDKHISWNLNWIKEVNAPNFVVIEVDKHYFDKNKQEFVTVK